MIIYYDRLDNMTEKNPKNVARDFNANEYYYLHHSGDGEPTQVFNQNFDEQSFLTLEKEKIRIIRDQKLNDTMWVKQRHECEDIEITLGLRTETTLTEQQVSEWIVYWKSLRDIPNNINTVSDLQSLSWPIEPQA